MTDKKLRFEYTVEERVTRIKSLTEMLQDMICALTGREVVSVRLPDQESWSQSNDIAVRVVVKDQEHMALTIGARKSVVQILLMFLRAQQVMPHNKVINLVIETEDGTKLQAFKEANPFGFNPRKSPHDDFYVLLNTWPPHQRQNGPPKAPSQPRRLDVAPVVAEVAVTTFGLTKSEVLPSIALSEELVAFKKALEEIKRQTDIVSSPEAKKSFDKALEEIKRQTDVVLSPEAKKSFDKFSEDHARRQAEIRKSILSFESSVTGKKLSKALAGVELEPNMMAELSEAIAKASLKPNRMMTEMMAGVAEAIAGWKSIDPRVMSAFNIIMEEAALKASETEVFTSPEVTDLVVEPVPAADPEVPVKVSKERKKKNQPSPDKEST